MRFTPLAIAGSFVLFATSTFAPAQVPPFNGGGVVAFDPEISVVNSGALLDAQVVVSSDRKYVTINARPSLSRLQSLNVFPVQQVGNGAGNAGGGGAGGAQMGFVGAAGFLDDEIGAASGTPLPEQSAASAARAANAKKPGPIPASPVKSSPSEILKIDPTAADSVLRKEGMFRIETK
ncbi:hypothetical protein BH09PLA1_BH09PLA1_08600 [soil metagenome]